MQLSELALLSHRLAATSRRTEKIELLAAALQRMGTDEVRVGIDYLSGRLPQGRVGIGGAMLTGVQEVAPSPRPSLTLLEADRAFSRFAGIRGAGSTEAKRRLLAELFARCTPEEQDFLARLALGELRQGALEGLTTEALARAGGVPAEAVRRALMVAGGLGTVAETLLGQGAAELSQFLLQPLQPVKPMLAQTADGIEEALTRLGLASFEYKLDGARVQVHKAGNEVRVFSRRQNDVTEAVPELVERVRRLPARELILDGETIALRSDGAPHPFQVTMRRFGRRRDVERMRRTLPLSVFFFDCLYVDGTSLVDQPMAERLGALETAVPGDWRVPRRVTADPARATELMRKALEQGHEGLMAKALAAPYEAGARGASWLKLKPFHTLDLVILAAEWGHGRRQGWLSNLHLGARDPLTGGYVMLGKTFKGMSDEMLEWQTRQLRPLAVTQRAETVYVRPELVVEVAFNDLQASPQYPAGLALRFARVRRYRPDKRPEEADTIETVRALAGGGESG